MSVVDDHLPPPDAADLVVDSDGRRLEETIAEHRRAEWLRDNAEAIDAYNEHIERRGVFSDGLRNF